MTRGRKSVPSMHEVGIWFRHRGIPVNMENRATGTISGIMNHDHLLDNNSHVKRPSIFSTRIQGQCQQENPFSNHDNRNTLQDHGVYFLQNLGRQKIKNNINLKRDGDIITWGRHKEPEHTSSNSLYREDFLRTSCGDFSSHTHRRFSKHLPEPKPGPARVSSSTLTWEPVNKMAEKDYFQLLADTQHIIKPNPWNFSYHAHSFHELPESGRQILRKKRQLSL